MQTQTLPCFPIPFSMPPIHLHNSLPQIQLPEAASQLPSTVSSSFNSATASLENMGTLFAYHVESATDSTFSSLAGSLESVSGTVAGSLESATGTIADSIGSASGAVGSTLEAMDLTSLLPPETLGLSSAVADALGGVSPHFGEVAARAVLNSVEETLGQTYQAVAAAVVPMGQLLEADAAASLAAGPVGQLERGWDSLVDGVEGAGRREL